MEYKKIIVDSDQPLFTSAKSVQVDYILVTNDRNGVTREYKNKTEFWGHHGKKAGGQLAADKEFYGHTLTAEDFTIEECARLSPDIDDHLKEAERKFGMFISSIKSYAEDYVLVLGGEDNFRYDVAHIQKYKGERGDKPLIHQELYDAVVAQYSSKVVIAEGVEADDVVSNYAWENYKNYRKTGKWDNILAFCDKDLLMCISPSVNYLKLSDGIKTVTPTEAALAFAGQLLVGDSTDNILGLPNFTKAIQEKYGMGNTRGIGKATALKYLKKAESTTEMFSLVVEAYKSYYGEEPKPFTSHRGEELTYNWYDYLNENSKLLYMLREKGEVYEICHTLDKLGVEY